MNTLSEKDNWMHEVGTGNTEGVVEQAGLQSSTLPIFMKHIESSDKKKCSTDESSLFLLGCTSHS